MSTTYTCDKCGAEFAKEHLILVDQIEAEKFEKLCRGCYELAYGSPPWEPVIDNGPE